MKIAVDIDGVLRDLNKRIYTILSLEFPERADKFMQTKDISYRCLDALFNTREELEHWMYSTYAIGLFYYAPETIPEIVRELNFFSKCAEKAGHEVYISSVQKNESITATLGWLYNKGCKIKNIKFFETFEEKSNADFDVVIDDSPEILNAAIKNNKHAIKIHYKFNENIQCKTLNFFESGLFDLYNILDIPILNRHGCICDTTYKAYCLECFR